MKFDELIQKIGNLPLLDTEILKAGLTDESALKVQISRWLKVGKLIRLRRGYYLLAEPYRKMVIYEPYIASTLVRPSYVSLEKALEIHGMIPEAVYVQTSVTTKRPLRLKTPVGVFSYRHIKKELFWGYEARSVENQTAFIAAPEKALLDLFYFRNGKITEGYLEEMRFQNFEAVDLKKMEEYAGRFRSPKIRSGARLLSRHLTELRSRYKKL